MKRKMNYLVLTVIFTLLLCGCSGSAESGQESDVLTISSLDERDNSLHVYSATLNAPLRVENPEGSIAGGGMKLFMGVSRACYFKKHVYDVERLKDCWDELAYVTDAGEKGAICFDFENQLWDVGFAAGTNHYVALDYEIQADGEEYQYFFTERDDNQEVLRKFPLNFLRGSDLSEVIMSLSDFAVDASGVVHIMRRTGEERQYLLISPEGELLAEYILEEGYIMRLVPLYDGHVALWTVTWPSGEEQGIRMTLQCMNQEAEKPILLATSEQEFYCFTLLDENTTLCANETGVYCGDLSGNNLEPLYLWVDHGLTVFGVSAIRADAEGKIALIYKDSEGYNYLCMEPTEEVEIQEITLAVSPARMSLYQNVVAAFNKQYPSCHIVLKDDYDRTVLLTELTAGKGPVLIDTLLTGFEEQEKLWEPLDNILERQGIMEELQPSVLELGRINGTVYGVATDFSLRTLVTGDLDLKDWDYDTFLQCVEDRPDLEAIFNLYGGDYGTYFIMNFISHGIDDNYLFDAATGKMNFDSGDFRRALELAKKYCVREEGVRPGRSLLEGKVLCNVLSITRPEQLALYRVCYGENANYIGYPARDGAAHFVDSGNSLLAIRRTATEEEKELAGAFISLCLSYEGQLLASKDLNFDLSVRKDVLEEQIAAMDKDTVAYVAYFDEFRLGDDLNIERDRETLLDLIGKARPMKYFPVELQNILFEELEPYFSGAITEDMVISHLESRVGLYLEERK